MNRKVFVEFSYTLMPAQALGKIGVDAKELGIDYLTIVGHKVNSLLLGQAWTWKPMLQSISFSVLGTENRSTFCPRFGRYENTTFPHAFWFLYFLYFIYCIFSNPHGIRCQSGKRSFSCSSKCGSRHNISADRTNSSDVKIRYKIQLK